ncbi:MAG: integrase core domain-containing protein [Thermodesulfobacteriota bacterium]
MEFFNHIHCKYTGIRGFVTLYNDYLKYQYMIQEKAKKKAEIVSFFEKYGLEPTISAFKYSKSSIYNWRKTLKENQGRIESLNEKSKAPHHLRESKIDQRIKDFISYYRKEHPRTGQDKIKPELDLFCQKMGIKSISKPTIARVIKELKERGEIPKRFKVSLYGKTGKIVIREQKPGKRKLRRKGYLPENPGDLIQMDAIVKFVWGIKRYIITALDLKSEFAFAFAYSHLSSKTATDFFEKLQKAAPFEIKRIQTDNGAEFQKRFRDALERKGIIQFFNYPRRPQMNAQVERFNRTIQEDFIDWNLDLLSKDIDAFNQKLVDWLLWYNTQRTHSSLKGQSPLQYLISNLGFSKMLVYYASVLTYFYVCAIIRYVIIFVL